MNKIQVSRRMRDLTIQIADLQAEFRAMLVEKTRLDLIKPVKRKTIKRKTAMKRRKRRKVAKKA